MQKLTDELKAEFRGVTIYGIGDAAHRSHPSGHNEDDTPGSKPELTDSDSKPEHRAIDVMIGPAFSRSDADALVSHLITRCRNRLYYIIWNGHIWSRSNGWVRRVYTGSDKHTDHVHISGWAEDDENRSTWFPANPVRSIMEQTEKLRHATDSTSRTVGHVLADLANLRNWLVSPAGSQDEYLRPRDGSPLALLLAAFDVLDEIAARQAEHSKQLADIQAKLTTIAGSE
jgi:hypothetical protein